MYEILVNPDVFMDMCAFFDDLGVQYGVSDKREYTLLFERQEQCNAVDFVYRVLREKYNAN